MPTKRRVIRKPKLKKSKQNKLLLWIGFAALLLFLPLGIYLNRQENSSKLADAAEVGALTFSQEFNNPVGTKPDPAVWTYNTGLWTNELETYTTNAENAQTDGLGNLVITAMKDGKGGYTSARIHTGKSFSQAYGKIEARMKLPPGQGLLPAFWMLGANFETVPWPDSGEIDIMEEPGDGAIHMSLHGHGDTSGVGLTGQYSNLDVTQWHIYGVDWTPTEITWTIDGAAVQTITKQQAGSMWSFDNPEFIILNLAVGGWAGTPPAATTFPAKLYVDYIRAYAYVPQATPTPLACTTSSTAFQNVSIAPQNGQFAFTFSATPNQANMDGVIGLSQTQATAYSNLAAIVRFNSNGVIDARKGSIYAADVSVPYTPGVPYAFRMVVNVPSRTYTVYVRPPGGTEMLLATNYPFRTEQAGVTTLANIGYVSLTGTNTLCNPHVSGIVSNPTPTPTRVPTLTPSPRPTNTPTPIPLSNGLNGSYFTNSALSGTPRLTRIDANINFNWVGGSPNPVIPNDNFSARWTGKIVAPSSGTWKFTTQSDDAVRLWVNGKQIINNWNPHPLTTNSGSIYLTANNKYDIKLEYFEATGNAVIKLFWSGPGTSNTIIPSNRLWTR